MWSRLANTIGDADCEEEGSIGRQVLQRLRELEPDALRSLHAALYEALELLPHSYDLTRAHLEAALRDGPSDVLDIGCGTGSLALPAARMNDRVIAVEPSPEMRARLQARLARESLANRVTCAPHRFEDTRFGRGSFDVVHMRLVAHMISPRTLQDWISRIAGLLRGDGRLVLSALFEGGRRRAGLKRRTRCWLASEGKLAAYGWMLETMQIIQRQLLIEPNAHGHDPARLAHVIANTGALRVVSQSSDHFEGKVFLLTASAHRVGSRSRREAPATPEPQLEHFSDLVAYLSEDVDWSPTSDSPARLRRIEAGLRSIARSPRALQRRCEEIASSPALLDLYHAQMEYPKSHFEVFVLHKDPDARFKVRMHRFKTLVQTGGSLEPVHSHRWDAAGVVLLGGYLENFYRVDRVDQSKGTAALTLIRQHYLGTHQTRSMPANRFAHQTVNSGGTPCITLFVRGTSVQEYNTSFDVGAGSCAPGYAASERDPSELGPVEPLRHALRCMGRLDPHFSTLAVP